MMMMSQFVKLYSHTAPSSIETADETKGASGASAEAEGDKYEVLKQKYTQLRLDHTDRGKRVNELETEAALLCRELRERSEYGLYHQRGGRDRGGRECDRDISRPWDAERNLGGERAREKRQESPAEGPDVETAKR